MPTAPRAADPALDPELARVRTLARLLDDYYLDPILGFVLPGLGDLVGSLLGLYIVVVAARRKLSPVLLSRMLMNLALDAAIGVVPVIGDLGDIVFKANDANLALLLARDASGGKATAHDWAILGGAVAAFVGVVAVTGYAMYRLVHLFY